MRVMSTDYQNYAALMICLRADDPHRCQAATDNIIILSRTADITDAYLTDMLDDIDQKCFQGDDLQWIIDEGLYVQI